MALFSKAQKTLVEWYPPRAGIIPYRVDARTGRKLYCFGVDSKHHELTDFGGGIRKSDKSTLAGMLRELHEEALGVFDDWVDLEGINASPCLYSKHMAILFVPLKSDAPSCEQLMSRFIASVGKEKERGRTVEVTSIVWINEAILRSYLRNETTCYGVMYSRVKSFLRSSEVL